jgi:hypothetical protein
MSEKKLRKELLNADFGPTAATRDPRVLTQNILQRDRRRIRHLTGLAIFLWSLAAAGVIALTTFYFLMLSPRLHAYAAGRNDLDRDWTEWSIVADLAAGGIVACIVVLLLAAVSTVMLILATRRATLRQINAGLVAISQQLKLLQQSSATVRTPPGESA